MFAEELSGNASRRRQAENRARRRQQKLDEQKKQKAKQQQQQKQQLEANQRQQEQQASSAPAAVVRVPVSATTTTNKTAFEAFTTTTPLSTTTKKSNNALQNAAMERQARQKSSLFQKSATRIQSFVRWFLCRKSLKQEHGVLLKQRLQDLGTLRQLLLKASQQQQQPQEYIPPPATSTLLVRQLLFTCQTNLPLRQTTTTACYLEMGDTNQDLQNLQHVLQYICIPGINSEDPNANPFATWMQSREGRYRIRSLIKLCFVALLQMASSNTSSLNNKNTTTILLSNIILFLRKLVCLSTTTSNAKNNNTTTTAITSHLLPYFLSSKPILFRKNPKHSSSTTTTTKQKQQQSSSSSSLASRAIPPFAYKIGDDDSKSTTNTSMDIVQFVRYYLLHFTNNDGTAHPIPQQSVHTREECISKRSKPISDALFVFVVDFMTAFHNDNNNNLRCRFFQEIFTIPLLTWKLSTGSIAKLFSSVTSPQAQQQEEKEDDAIVIVSILNAFVKQNKHALANGQISYILPNIVDANNNTTKVLSTFCPATNTQCLLANLIQIGRLCPSWNGDNNTTIPFDYHSTATFFHILSSLLDVVPIGTFLSRDSAVVEWVDNDDGGGGAGGGGATNAAAAAAASSSSSTSSKTHFTPIVLSPVILDQCRLLLLDSYVRKLFYHATTITHTTAASNATNNNQLKSIVDDIIMHKNEKDRKYEQEFIDAAKDAGSGSATTLAAKEARTNRSQGFWNSSKWANKLTKGVSTLFSSVATTPDKKNNNDDDYNTSNKNKNKNGIKSPLQRMKKNSNDTNNSQQTTTTSATTATASSSAATIATNSNYSPKLFFALCRAYGIILARWGGNGSQDVLLDRGGGGRSNYSSSGSSMDVSSSEATSKPDPCTTSLLNVLCFSTDALRTSWAFIQSDDTLMENVQNVMEETTLQQQQQYSSTKSNLGSSGSGSFTSTTEGTTIRSQTLRPFYDNYRYNNNDSNNNNWTKMIMSMSEKKKQSPLMMIATNGNSDNDSSNSSSRNNNKQIGLVMENDGTSLFFMFVCTFSHTLIITDDVEIHDMGKPLPIHQIRRSIVLLKKLLCRACSVTSSDSHHDDDGDNDQRKMSSSSSLRQQPKSNYFGLAIISWSSRTMRELYDRSSRRPICLPKLWLTNSVDESIQQYVNKHCKTHRDYMDLLLTSPILRICPFLISFKRRLKLFERIITTSRLEVQGAHENLTNNSMINSLFQNQHPLKPGIPVQITRGRILEDGLLTLNKMGRNLRQRIAVQYVNEAGSKEVGVDAGGLFKEFWTDLSVIAFNPNYALFRVTEESGGDSGHDNCLYPNPSSKAAHGAADSIMLFEFLGRILGKALYEGITIHPKFAHFFLSFLRGDYNYLHMLPDLSTIDVQLYNNLMFLKTYDGNAEDLCLSFTINNDDFGKTKELPLIPNGANIPVTNSNKQRYIGLVAKYYVVDRVKEQSEAFTRGLWDVIDRSWLRLFNEPELQVLISGATDGKIDVDDMRSNTRYTGGYTGIELTISRFWNVVSSLSGKQQGLLLRFVTSCERPPPLGFSSMNPPFTIQRVGIMRDSNTLPTASTCFNVLKLPTYSSEKVLRSRLVYAIESGAGFELS